MAPQPLGPSGPMARGLLMRTGTQDVDMISFPAQRTNMHEVRFCFDFHVNNTTLECLLGSKSAGQRPTHQPLTSLPEHIAKQVPCQPDSYLKKEPNVRTLWPDTRMMVSLTRFMVHFAVPVPMPLSASPNHFRIEKLEDGLRLCGKRWPQNSMKSSLNEMLKICSLSLHLMYVHKSSALWIAGTGWGNRFSILHLPDTNILLILLLLACVVLAFLMMYCDRSFVKPAIWLRIVRPLCDGRPFASSPFRRLASRGSLFAVSLRGGLCKLRSIWLDA